MAKKDDSDSKLFGFLGVFLTWLGFIIVMVAKKDDKYAMFYAKQGLVIGIAWIVAWVIWIVPILGWIIGGLLSLLLFVLWIIGIIYAFSGEEKDIPIIGSIAKKINI